MIILRMLQFIRREWAMASEKSRILFVLGILFSILGLIVVYLVASGWRGDPMEADADKTPLQVENPSASTSSDVRSERRSRMQEQLVFKNHIDALGGARALSRTVSIRFTGKVQFEDGTVQEVLVVKKDGHSMRVSVSTRFSQTNIIISHDEGWRTVERFNQTVEIVKLPESELLEHKRYIHVVSELYLASVNGWEKSYLGQQQFNNQMAHVYEVIPNTGHTIRFYIHPTTFLNIGREDITTGADGTVSKVIRFHSGHIRADDLTLPGKVENYVDGRLKQTLFIEQAEINSGILDSAFNPPRTTP